MAKHRSEHKQGRAAKEELRRLWIMDLHRRGLEEEGGPIDALPTGPKPSLSKLDDDVPEREDDDGD